MDEGIICAATWAGSWEVLPDSSSILEGRLASIPASSADGVEGAQLPGVSAASERFHRADMLDARGSGGGALVAGEVSVLKGSFSA